MEYIRKKFMLGRENKLELRLDTPLELQGNNWYCGLREFSLEQKWSLANEEITIYYQNGHNTVVKPGYYHSVAQLDNILDELFLPMRVKRGGRKALDRMAGIRNRQYDEEESEEEPAAETETKTEAAPEPETKSDEKKTSEAEAETKSDEKKTSEAKTERKIEAGTKSETETKAKSETETEAKTGSKESEKKEKKEETPAKKQKIDPQTFESAFKKENEVKLHWIPKTGHFPEHPAKVYPKPVAIEKDGPFATVVAPTLPVAQAQFGRKEIPKAPDIDILKKYLNEGEKTDENKAGDKTIDSKIPEFKPIGDIPSQYPVPSAPKPLPDFGQGVKKEEPETNIVIPAPDDSDESGEDQTIVIDDQRGVSETTAEDKKSDLLEGERITAEQAKVKVEPKEEKPILFFLPVKQEIVKEEVKISPEVLEFNQKGYNSVRIVKNVDNYYTITFDPSYVAAVSLSEGFARALGFTKTSITTTGDIATDYPSSETDISHICVSINHILRPLNDEKTAEIGIIPVNDQTKTIHEYFANPLWFKLETTRVDHISLEFRDFFGNPIACDNAHGHFALVFANQKR